MSSKKNICPLFGKGKVLPKKTLPTKNDVLSFIKFKNIKVKHLHLVADDLIQIWKSKGLNTIKKQNVTKQIKKLFKKYSNFMKAKKRITHRKFHQYLLNEFKVKCNSLFDISQNEKYFKSATCNDKDNGTTMENNVNDSSESEGSEDNIVTEYQPPKKVLGVLKEKKEKPKLSSVALIAERFKISDRAAAAITTAAFESAGLIDNNNFIIDRQCIRRTRSNIRTKLRSKALEKVDFICLAFDGRKDDTIQNDRMDDNHFHRQVVKEEHIVLLSEPGAVFLGHISPETSHAKTVTKSILDFLDSNNFDSNFKAVLCDGCNVNTGKQNGIIRSLEMQLNRPLQWLVCLLHMNELPFSHLFKHLDGSTNSPIGFKGKRCVEKQNSRCVCISCISTYKRKTMFETNIYFFYYTF